MLVPASLIMMVIQWAGLLARAEPYLAPLMQAIHLPGAAAIPIVTGLFLGNYTVIAMLGVVPFGLAQKTLISVFTMTAHNLPIEGLIQHQSGLNLGKITAIRLGAAFLTTLLVAHFFSGTTASVTLPVDFLAAPSFAEAARAWAIATGWLLVKIFGIIIGIMVLLEALQVFGWINYIIRFLRPVMRVLGLSERTSALWVMGVVFGLMYGGAAIMEEVKKGELTKDELERLHISLGINHSMVEDPLLFIALGINGFWLWVPKLLASIVAVQLYRAISSARRLAQH
jgi:Fe2+ transport system protein B